MPVIRPTRTPALSKIIHILVRWLPICWLLYAALHSMDCPSPRAEKEDASAKRHTATNYSLGAVGLQYISTWQLCNFFEASCGWGPMCQGPDCLHFNSHPLFEDRLDILAHAPGIKHEFDIGESQYPIEARVSRHLGLARLARTELEYRFPIDVNTLQNIGDVCVDLPQFNVTVADILPWYDLFDDWDRKLGYKISMQDPVLVKFKPELEYIHSYIRRAVNHVNQILNVRNGEHFKQLVTMYGEAGCSS
ncbi:hypothetical protein CHU98_g5886 [Xylaria longipes]|nr:hypothetical protein CHU98_g5886 [Xylaria longipes]